MSESDDDSLDLKIIEAEAKQIMANVIQSEEVTFLCGMDTLKAWKNFMSFNEYKLKFDQFYFIDIKLVSSEVRLSQ